MNIIRPLPLLVLSFLLGFISLAQAHAFLDHAEPRVGETLKASPTVVKIWFTRGIEPDGSNISVFDSQGLRVDQKSAKFDSDDQSLMCVSVPKLPSGTYKVVWNAVCRDTHHTSGTYTFVVSP
jgi:methionine-rich copper-binding protein CopC